MLRVVPTVMIMLLVACPAVDAAGDARGPSGRIFRVWQARQALELARSECKPLVVHFAPDTRLGQRQVWSFYAGPEGVAPELLEKVVIVVIPTRRYEGLARNLGIKGAGGYRTISAYGLESVDTASRSTCRSGFV